MHVMLRNEQTDETKEVEIGWSWFFFLSPAFGIPLFVRGLSSQGWTVLGIEALSGKAFRIFHEKNPGALGFWLLVIAVAVIGYSTYMATKGNELAAKKLLDNGWSFDDDERLINVAKTKWSLV